MLTTLTKTIDATVARYAAIPVIALLLLVLIAPAQAQQTSPAAHNPRVSVVLRPGDGLVRMASLDRSETSDVETRSPRTADREVSTETKSALNCLARAIYFEARGESADGQTAVGRVILNRVNSPAYPDTVCDVVYQNARLRNRCQFSFACDGSADIITEQRIWRDIRDLADRLLHEKGPLQAPVLLASTHYHALSVSPRWARKLTVTGRIGQHIFYREKSS
ncbi:hypothetical protein ASG43_05355 [Aureimonas sp. Leaf454]|uniref:cell wall hydrolase n=1 Tax=Aureimonas sp. Leaf454 TaxID=1736381 RepID=UPI0006F99314|nr:cell wall hydrolase [Aureimonas sp. Leaf454]KQT50710.1 hypothetical protein ASG43_05355 [Aureimonas sp. Leaf454]